MSTLVKALLLCELSHKMCAQVKMVSTSINSSFTKVVPEPRFTLKIVEHSCYLPPTSMREDLLFIHISLCLFEQYKEI